LRLRLGNSGSCAGYRSCAGYGDRASGADWSRYSSYGRRAVFPGSPATSEQKLTY
jgi:hypothetical protein